MRVCVCVCVCVCVLKNRYKVATVVLNSRCVCVCVCVCVLKNRHKSSCSCIKYPRKGTQENGNNS